MFDVFLRKRVIIVEEIFHEGGPIAVTPLQRGAILAVIQNPFTGRYVEDIAEFMDDLKPLGLAMASQLVAALGGDPTITTRRTLSRTSGCEIAPYISMPPIE